MAGTSSIEVDPARGVLIGGEWRAGGRGVFEVHDPADRSVLASVADADLRDTDRAVGAAAAAFETWRLVPARERADLLRRAFESMLERQEDIAQLIAAENGKSLADARGEVGYSAEFFRWFSEEAVRTEGDYGPSPAGGTRTIVAHRPVGVAALVTPWNFPAAMVARKVAPALAAGCTVVLKPAAETPLTALALARLLEEAGVPPGVVNVVPTLDAGGVVGRLLADPRVRKISFTGSTRVGALLLRQAADRIVNSSMELGGNAPFVVTEDADLDAAVTGAMTAKFRNGGQACTAANRFYVHEEVIDEFVARFGDAVERLTTGAAFSGADIGPLISARAIESVTRTVDRAVADGARITHRAALPDLAGWFYPPTVLTDVAPDAAILQEELFAPVAPVVRWSDENELIALVNRPEVGLASYVFTRDLQRALRLGESFEAGMVAVNRGLLSDPAVPFGGVKASGLGREGAREGLREFQETQAFSVQWP